MANNKYRTSFVVEGSGEFPWDMLRYDRVTPYHETDTNVARAHSLPSQGLRRVTVVRDHESKAPPITPARWESFGWRVDVLTLNTERI